MSEVNECPWFGTDWGYECMEGGHGMCFSTPCSGPPDEEGDLIEFEESSEFTEEQFKYIRNRIKEKTKREILFRGKAINNSFLLHPENGWVYGVPVPILINNHMTDRVEIVKCHGYDELDSFALMSYDEEVDPDTVGQFTGLTDKNGKKIFEGDIIKATAISILDEDIEATVTIRLDDYELMWDVEHSAEVEVIGNIHDNPELVKEGD